MSAWLKEGLLDGGFKWWENECHEGEHDVEHLYQGDKSKLYQAARSSGAT